MHSAHVIQHAPRKHILTSRGLLGPLDPTTPHPIHNPLTANLGSHSCMATELLTQSAGGRSLQATLM